MLLANRAASSRRLLGLRTGLSVRASFGQSFGLDRTLGKSEFLTPCSTLAS